MKNLWQILLITVTIGMIFLMGFIVFGIVAIQDKYEPENVIQIENNYVEYKPHYLSDNSENKYYGEPELDSIEFANTIQVLKFYEEDYETKNGTLILIPKELIKDWTLLWNYTTKANDIEWLDKHKVE